MSIFFYFGTELLIIRGEFLILITLINDFNINILLSRQIFCDTFEYWF